MKMHVLDIKGNKTEEITLNKDIFAVTPNDEVMGQYLRVYSSNQRQGTAKAKTRSEVAGSGAKPWRQKGTGRARVGDKRNPLWRHGGISHGPLPKDWSLTLTKYIKKFALVSALSYKAGNQNLFVIDSLDNLKGKTKEGRELLKALKLQRKTLIITDAISTEQNRSLNNIKDITLADSARLNAYQVLANDNVVISKKALSNLEKRLKA